MTEVTLALEESGRNSTTLHARVGNELQVSWILTDAQLAYLAAQAVRIVKSRAESGMIRAEELKAALAGLIGGKDAA